MLPNLQNREEGVVLLTIFRTAPAWITAAECCVFRTLLAVEQCSVRLSPLLPTVRLCPMGALLTLLIDECRGAQEQHQLDEGARLPLAVDATNEALAAAQASSHCEAPHTP